MTWAGIKPAEIGDFAFCTKAYHDRVAHATTADPAVRSVSTRRRAAHACHLHAGFCLPRDVRGAPLAGHEHLLREVTQLVPAAQANADHAGRDTAGSGCG